MYTDSVEMFEERVRMETGHREHSVDLVEGILSKRVDVLPKQRGREAQNIVSITWPSARSWPTIGPMCSVFQATTVT